VKPDEKKGEDAPPSQFGLEWEEVEGLLLEVMCRTDAAERYMKREWKNFKMDKLKPFAPRGGKERRGGARDFSKRKSGDANRWKSGRHQGEN